MKRRPPPDPFPPELAVFDEAAWQTWPHDGPDPAGEQYRDGDVEGFYIAHGDRPAAWHVTRRRYDAYLRWVEARQRRLAELGLDAVRVWLADMTVGDRMLQGDSGSGIS